MADFIAVIDLETNGLDHRSHSILEYGVVLLRASTLEEVESRRAWVRVGRPTFEEGERNGAFSVNKLGFDFLLEHGRTRTDALTHALGFIDWERTLPAFWPVEFDRAFIEEEFRWWGQPCWLPRRSLDVRSVAYSDWFLRTGEWDACGLSSYLEKTASLSSLDLPLPLNTAPHDALHDAVLTANALRRATQATQVRLAKEFQ